MTDYRRWVYQRDDARRRIRVTAKVALDAADLAAIVERQVADGTWSFGILYDLRNIQGATNRADAQATSDLVQGYVTAHGPRGRVAVVTKNVKMLGAAQGYAFDGAKAGIEMQVFWDLADAEAWLAQPM